MYIAKKIYIHTYIYINIYIYIYIYILYLYFVFLYTLDFKIFLVYILKTTHNVLSGYMVTFVGFEDSVSHKLLHVYIDRKIAILQVTSGR